MIKGEIMKKIIVLVGLPGSGKSTWAEEYKKENVTERVQIINSDEIRKKITGSYQNFNYEDEVWHEFDNQIFAASYQKQPKNFTVIVDATHLSEYRRICTLSAGDNFKHKTMVHFNIPFETCLARQETRPTNKRVPKHIMYGYENKFQHIQSYEKSSVDQFIEIKGEE
jgi:predicted kinase